jgi:hypothetical protein
MNEPPVRAIASVTRYVNQVAADAVEDHVEQMHIPSPRHGRLTAIPFPWMRLSDVQTAKAREMIELGASVDEILAALDVPLSVLERALAEYKPAWRNFLAEREAGL